MSPLLTPFGPDIWVADGPVVPFFTFPYPTRMAIVRLSTQALFVWSPIALSPALKAQVDALGTVAHIVSPNSIHHLFMGDWQKAYPEARLYASPDLARKRKDLAFAATLGNVPESGWAAEIDQVAMEGSFVMTEIVFFHRSSRTAIFADLIENFAPGWFKGWRGVLARLDGLTAPDPGAPKEWRATFLNRRKARAALSRILAWEAEKAVVAHGALIERGAAEAIRKSFRWLSPA